MVYLPPHDDKQPKVDRGEDTDNPKVRVVKCWNKLPTSVVTAPPVNVFKKRLEKVWTEVIPHLPHWLSTHRPPFPPAQHSLTVFISICYPTPCFVYVVSSGPLWPTCYHFKSLSFSEPPPGRTKGLLEAIQVDSHQYLISFWYFQCHFIQPVPS